jgi:ABC-2 type transport system permease protein
VLVLGGVALVFSSRRDVGDGVLASRDVARLRPFGLGSALGMTVRRELPVLVAWCAGALASGAVLGVIAKVTTGAPSASLNDALEKFNVKGGFAQQYLGVAFLLVATVVALIPAGQVGAAGDEETSGRLVHVLARAPSRTAWFAGRLVCCAVAVAAAGLLAGLAAYAGAASQGLNLALASMLGAGLNVVPTALVALGVGALVLAVAPRVAAGAVYGFIVASLVIDLSASLVTGLGWLEHLSLFHYMALAPAQHPDPSTLAVTTAIALLLCIGATMVFRARDLRVG